ncbi:aldo/keto reductase [Streptomyces caelestis]|jgi:aryl-alcohol dehydrogenase-like predicted oxidoreductase|uniref:Aryl-alcohol dehydrogenase-like predicted oxidoreductase n=1 Tax=Streptomyces caelestis TaxID=36816 RepID=A0A7W9LS95_9ACTN|nr:aldo/keto reductase [Streptomyces caelestis]MBB5794323.1 aryl-alcohol dehydrogenase-like predicted oxidoreductase [Streptomyces caelestis]GGW31577.1 oxidoreductase [Streptomyces caelestis]
MSPDLALGTYRCRNIPQATVHAIACGATWIDTAPNYHHGRAQPQLQSVLAGNLDLRVSTKAGFFTPDIATAARDAGVLTPAEAASGHCLTHRYVAWQSRRNATELGRTPDLVFVHNPERAARPHDAIAGAFTALEVEARAGRIGSYGVATWTGFEGAFSVADLLDIATRCGGPGHHLAAVQLPVSLVMLKPVAQALDGTGPLAEATAAGLNTFISAPLHGGELPAMVTDELAQLIDPGTTPADAALLVTVSTPGVNHVILGAGRAQHWQAAQRVLALPPLPAKTLHEVVDVLGA